MTTNLNIKLQYPFNEEYDYVSRLTRINLDQEREMDIRSGNGFIISEPQSIKKDLKSDSSIFSTKFGQTLQDLNPFIDKYKCECGFTRSRINHGIECSVCHTKVKYVDDNFGYFGWVVLKDPYYVIHPNLYKSIEFLIGSERLKKILKIVDEKDANGFTTTPVAPKKKTIAEDIYDGIGMMKFKDKFTEVLDYYLSKSPAKKDYYDDIIQNIDLVFVQSVPVYTTLLRPFKVEGKEFRFEGTNATYNIICKLVYAINRDNVKMFREKKPKNLLLFDLQIKYNELYKEIEDILAKKKGAIRSLFGGRYNFSARSVIIPNPSLRIDEITLPYHCLVELLQQSIVNILQKTYNVTYAEAYKIWYKAQTEKSDRVYNIINGLIKDKPRGIPILINRKLLPVTVTYQENLSNAGKP